MAMNTSSQYPDISEKEHLELTISRMSDVIGDLVNTIGSLLSDLDPYHDGFCIVCGCPQPSRKIKHDHRDDCAYVAAQKTWQSFQVPDDGPTLEDLS